MEKLYNPNFRFREIEIEKLHEQLNQGESVLLTGIRRTGKTEVIKAALYQYCKQGHAVAWLDAQDINDLSVFYQQLLTALVASTPKSFQDRFNSFVQAGAGLPNQVANWLKKHISKVDVGDIGVEMRAPEQLATYWQAIVDEIATLLAEQPREQLPVIGIDELPFMLANLIKENVPTDELVMMLASLRKLRGAGLRMVLGGSVSFENLLTIHNISHIVLGGLFRLPIKPFTRAEAQSFLQEKFGNAYAAQNEPMTLILDSLPDYVPEILTIASGHLKTCKSLQACQLSLDNDVMPAIRRAFVQQFQERLTNNYSGEERDCAEQILDQLAEGAAEGVKLDSRLFAKNYFLVLSKLQYDNFLQDAPHGAWQFSLNAIRIWWRNNRGMN